jgi:hypothetical protein
VDEIALELAFSEFFCFPPLIITQLLIHNHLSPPREVFDSRNQAAHYQTLGPKLQRFISDSALVWSWSTGIFIG